MFEVQEEAECIVREGDLEFYRAWADRVLDKPTNYNFIHFRQEIELMNGTLQNTIQKKEEGKIHKKQTTESSLAYFPWLENQEKAMVCRSRYQEINFIY
jgi:hypothetical protein